MGKYESVLNDVFSVFDSAAWIGQNIAVFPTNYTGQNGLSEFLRITVLASRYQVANQLQSVSGQLLVEIFTSAGEGPTRAFLIADILDGYLAGKVFVSDNGSTTQLISSTLGETASDGANTSLAKTLYTIPFNYYGVK